jgi:hypothetical protein
MNYMCDGATTADIAGRKSDGGVRSSFVIDRRVPNADTQNSFTPLFRSCLFHLR